MIKDNICEELRKMHEEAGKADDTVLIKKIEATQKNKDCRNKRKRGG